MRDNRIKDHWVVRVSTFFGRFDKKYFYFSVIVFYLGLISKLIVGKTTDDPVIKTIASWPEYIYYGCATLYLIAQGIKYLHWRFDRFL